MTVWARALVIAVETVDLVMVFLGTIPSRPAIRQWLVRAVLLARSIDLVVVRVCE